MPIDTFVTYVGTYATAEGALADDAAVKDLHVEAGLFDAYDAAVVERRVDGKVKVLKKHETPTRAGGVLGGGIGLATGLAVALFPFAAIGGGLLAGTAAAGAVLGAVTGHAAAGLSRHDLKEMGEHLDAGAAGLVVVGGDRHGGPHRHGPQTGRQAAQEGDEGRPRGHRGRRRLRLLTRLRPRSGSVSRRVVRPPGRLGPGRHLQG